MLLLRCPRALQGQVINRARVCRPQRHVHPNALRWCMMSSSSDVTDIHRCTYSLSHSLALGVDTNPSHPDCPTVAVSAAPTSTSPHLTSPHLTSPHLTSPHLTSPHLTSPHLTSPHLTSPHLTHPLTYHRRHTHTQHDRRLDDVTTSEVLSLLQDMLKVDRAEIKRHKRQIDQKLLTAYGRIIPPDKLSDHVYLGCVSARSLSYSLHYYDSFTVAMGGSS
jgi:hypothetical protein